MSSELAKRVVAAMWSVGPPWDNAELETTIEKALEPVLRAGESLADEVGDYHNQPEKWPACEKCKRVAAWLEAVNGKAQDRS